ncbi:MAG: hypothetical protein HY020_20200 [Burkholderiales bacterium]|nr:hypothetical protein [Burkholderiales bacterium]
MDASLHQILLAFWRQMDTEKNWGRRVFYGLLLAGLAVALWFMPNMTARLIIIWCVLAACAVGFWIALFINLMQQNQPQAARLVPGHLRRLRQAVLLAWLVPSCALGLLIWFTTMQVVSLPFVLLCATTIAFCTAWAQRYWVATLLLIFGPTFLGSLHQRERWAPLWRALADAWGQQPWAWLVVCLVIMGWLLTRSFGSGDAAHRAFYARRQRMQKAALDGMTGNRAGIAIFGRPGEWLGRPFDKVCAAWLAHLLARARPRQASVMARAEIALHGLQHWLRQLLGLSLTVLCVGLGFAMTFALVGHATAMGLKSGAFGIAIGLSAAGFNPGFALHNMLWHTRREQALLALLPGMPQGRALNQALARMQLRHFLVASALTTSLLLVVVQLAGQPALLCLPIAALPIGVLSLMRPPAAMRAPTGWSASKPVLGFFLLAGVLWGLCTWLDDLVWPLAGISLMLSATLMAWRWRAISQAPSALPAGRAA